MLPWLIGAGAVAAAGYLLSDDDGDKKARKKAKKRARKREESLARERRNEREIIEAEIESFKEISEEQISNKYGIEISFINAKIDVNYSDSNIEQLGKDISKSKTENKDMQNLITNLQEEKNEV